ncbi:cyclin-dependent protein kinase inhibitor [Macrolepiota fuliginosa MF-IS2]|uniref:Peroxisome assembly protein 12 n=1 Tax=Macrolepiota fuliginosa MF-IS2 TaxID=1400762 RepID=A0A9P5XM95_9AGAR|nr:cyclin-dependent protein kinase inhibitor [Macrolepiota fuliginosa MF-IS2]
MEFFNDVGSDPLKPSLFELVAQEQLRDLLQPALKYVLAVFAQRYPRNLLRIVNRHEEFYAAIMLVVETYYLRKHNASFSENFYGLKRRRRPFIETERTKAAVGGVPQGEALRGPEIWRSLVYLVGIPYLRAKAHDYYEELGGGVSSDILDEGMNTRQLRTLTEDSFKGKLRRVFKATYPWLNTSFEAWLLAWNVAYLFDKTPFYRPWLSWIRVDLRRLGVEDFRAASLAAQKKLSPAQNLGLIVQLRQLLSNSPRLLLDSLRLLLPTAIFFIKFLEWWYSPNSPARSLNTSPLGPAIPPPRMLSPHPQGLQVDRTAYGVCPLCRKHINNATALPSGYVFCYRCAYDFVDKQGKCPVTLLPTRTWQLRKVLFGKQIQAQQVPGWSVYYLDYKFLKKIISSLAANRPASEAALLALGTRATDVTSQASPSSHISFVPRSLANEPSPAFILPGNDSDKGPNFQAHKAAFFFKLERELEKINGFYLQKEAELRLRLETLLSKRRAAAARGFPDVSDTAVHSEWSAVEEGFRLLERDLGKLQSFVEINAIGFRKILKKYDKRSTSTTKELYLARQVDVQPVFDRQLISELSDTVAACLLDLTDLSSGLKFEGPAANDILTQQILLDITPSGPLRDLEKNFRQAIINSDAAAIKDCVHFSESLGQQNGGKVNVARILWNAIIESPPDLADLILSTLSTPFDFQFIDDINGRTCLHEAVIAGVPRLVDLCIKNGIRIDRSDVYGRIPLHYACMNGYPQICEQLLLAGSPPDALDRDNYSPLVYATLKGNVDCMRVLLEQGKVPVQSSSSPSDLIPLSLASQCGHVDAVILLLEQGATSLPNTNGEYPMHLAAREGHARICRLLLNMDGWDVRDKYHEWTPLFHAARYGRMECVQVLLEAGSTPHTKDELGQTAAHYAAWYGHHNCLALILAAFQKHSPPESRIVPKDYSPAPEVVPSRDSEIDMIPTLSLPPPAMPHRVYGHNFLDRNHLVQITIGPSSKNSSRQGVRLHHRLISPIFRDEYLVSSTPLKLVMTTTSPQVTSAPYSISLPQHGGKDIFTFQIPALDNLSLEFSIYPNFGTKTIGRAIALPSMFTKCTSGTHEFTLPILDTRLHSIGEVDFTISIITSFRGVRLEIGGGVETYWKSTAVHATPRTHTGLLRPSELRPSRIGSAQTSPAQGTALAGHQALPIISLQGEYLYVMVQVTRDLCPVVCSEWILPETGFELGVGDVTLVQFQGVAAKLGRDFNSVGNDRSFEWSTANRKQVLPNNINICIDLSPPCKSHPYVRRLDLNAAVDAVLRDIFDNPTISNRSRVIFNSFCPSVCAALNWKQPNYPVFFSSRCGKNNQHLPTSSYQMVDEENDDRLGSVGAAVEFAKDNNLLGVFVDAELLVQVPSLVEAMRNSGLIVGVHGNPATFTSLTHRIEADHNPIDAFISDTAISFLDHSATRELV